MCSDVSEVLDWLSVRYMMGGNFRKNSSKVPFIKRNQLIGYSRWLGLIRISPRPFRHDERNEVGRSQILNARMQSVKQLPKVMLLSRGTERKSRTIPAVAISTWRLVLGCSLSGIAIQRWLRLCASNLAILCRARPLP